MPKFIKFYDANRTKKIYPLIRFKPVETKITNSTATGEGASEAAIIEFVDSNQEVYTYTGSYTQIPTIVVSPTDENVNIFITSINTTSVTIESSAPFTGTVHLHLHEN